MASNRTPLNGLGPVVPGTSRTIPMVTTVNPFRKNTSFSVCNEHVVALSPVSTLKNHYNDFLRSFSFFAVTEGRRPYGWIGSHVSWLA